MNLHSIVLGEGPPLVILHGLFGSGRNWLSIGKKLAQSYQVFLVDLRNHGQSPHSPELNYDLMSQDLLKFFQDNQLQQAILIGHSMGGKVAMTFAGRYYPTKISHLIIVDIGPGYYPPTHGDILKALIELDIKQLKSRKEAHEILSETITDPTLRQFLLSNLYRTPEKKFAWRCNLPTIYKNIEKIGQNINEVFYDYIHFNDAPTLFIRGEKSEYINSQQQQLIESSFPEAFFTTIANAGHWVHVEQADPFLEVLLDFIKI